MSARMGKVAGLATLGGLGWMVWTLVIANAIYFKGQWLEPFDPASTKDHDFTLAGGKKVKVKTMTGHLGSARYGAFNKDGSFFNTPRRSDSAALLVKVRVCCESPAIPALSRRW